MEQESDESLIALTTHFAQVQFRLKQIISAEPQHKEGLLKELEDFAFQGCSKPMAYDTAAAGEDGSTEYQKRHRTELMEKLRAQLEELEQCAQEAAEQQHSAGGVAGEDQSGSLAEKQRIIIDELRKRFDLQFGDLEQLSTEEVKQNVNKAVHGIVDPIRSKEQYVSQLQTQIQDLERYITFLQVDHPRAQGSSPPPPSHPPHPHYPPTSQRSGTKRKRVSFAADSKPSQDLVSPPSPVSRSRLVGPILGSSHQPVPHYRLALTQLDGVHCSVDSTMIEWEKIDSLGDPLSDKGPDDLRLSLLVMRKTLAVMQILTLCQCGGSFHCLPRYVADGKRKRYHSALHSLELAVDKIAIITTALNEPGITTDACVSLEIDLHETVSMSLADSLRVLLEHGLLSEGKPVLLTGGCFPLWRTWGREHMTGGDRECPAWRVFKHYYSIKNGQEFSRKPEQLLSSSFDLPMDGSVSIKRTLLSSFHKIDHMYSSCQQRSRDTKFRALICEGFNVNHLAEWFRIVSTHPGVADNLYSVTSFLATTGFRPALACLERLRDNPPCQPVHLPHEYFQCADVFLDT